MKLRMFAAAQVFLILLASVQADDAKSSPAIVDPAKAKADADFNIQGEYAGTFSIDGESIKYGLQVIALGDHKFDGVAYEGGLPGADWQRGDTTHKASGETKAGVTRLDSDAGYAIIENGKATVYSTENDEALGELKKVNRKGDTLGAKPPKGAMVLFNGKSADLFAGGKIVQKKLLLADCETKDKFGSHQLHLEFRTPFKPKARGQARGNSGVYIQGRYECQVLDSFGLSGENNECGGIYSIAKPKVNACLPPLTWQTYDMDFVAPTYDADGKKTRNARVTIRQNGILIHDNVELPKHTPGKHPEANGPQSIYLQGHGNPVVYRNIWVVKK